MKGVSKGWWIALLSAMLVAALAAPASARLRPDDPEEQGLRDRFHDGALSAGRRAWFAAEQERWTASSILNALGVLVGTDLSDRLGAIRCPTLLLHPDGSPFIPVPIMAELHRLLPTSQLHVVGHARHGLPFSHDRLCARRLRSFLDSCAAG